LAAEVLLKSNVLSSMSTETNPITLYTAQTPNGLCISVALEEIGVPYIVRTINFKEDEQHSEWYVKINPNGKIPAIVDHMNSAGDFPVFETSAILLYLAENYDKEHKISYDPVTEANFHSEELQWLFFAHGGIGPMQGQAGHFAKFASEKIPYAINRYTTEVARLFAVLDKRLESREWLVGPHYGLADIKTFTWVSFAGPPVADLSDYPNIEAWIKRCVARDATYTGLGIPSRPDLERFKR